MIFFVAVQRLLAIEHKRASTNTASCALPFRTKTAPTEQRSLLQTIEQLQRRQWQRKHRHFQIARGHGTIYRISGYPAMRHIHGTTTASVTNAYAAGIPGSHTRSCPSCSLTDTPRGGFSVDSRVQMSHFFSTAEHRYMAESGLVSLTLLYVRDDRGCEHTSQTLARC